MSRSIFPRTAEALRASRPIVLAHRLPIIEGLADSLAAADPRRGRRWAHGAAAGLLDMLVEKAPAIADDAAPQAFGSVHLVLQRHDIRRDHLTRFGDALAAVMVDAAGAALPRPVGGAWGDAFWAIVRQASALGIGLAASRASARVPAGLASAGA